MKNTILLILFLIISKTTYCDEVPGNSHGVGKCVKIINADDFPDFYILACTQHPTGGVQTYIVNSNNCLCKGYHLNMFYILAIKKSDVGTKNIDTTNWLVDKNILKSNIYIEPDGGYVTYTDPVAYIEEFYTIFGFSDSTVNLFKCKEIVHAIDGRPLSTKIYSYPEEIGKIKMKSSFNTNSENKTSAFDRTVLNVAPFLKALLRTILVEILVLFLLFKTIYKRLEVKNQFLFITGILASLATLPYVWFVLPTLIQPTLLYVLISELSVVIIESLIIFKSLKIDYKKALITSTICNATSFMVGIIINFLN